jgi:hypothetical protein
VLFLQKCLYGEVYFYVGLQYFPTVAQSGKTISSKADERDMKYCEGAQLRMLSLCVTKKENLTQYYYCCDRRTSYEPSSENV